MQLVALCFFVLAFLFPAVSYSQQPKILYVNRSDPTCGGKSPCFTRIQSAVTAAQPGNIIHIQAGAYAEQVTVANKNRAAGSNELHRIVIESDPASPPGSVILRGSGQDRDDDDGCGDDDEPRYGFRFRNSRFVTLRDLTITGLSGPAIWLAPNGGGHDDDDRGRTGANVGIHIELNRIYRNARSGCNGGIVVSRGNSGTLIANNLIYANGRNGIAFEGNRGGPHYVINNTVFRNRRNGISAKRGHEIYIVNNIINQNGTASGNPGGMFGIQRENSNNHSSQGIHLLNNLVCGNRLGEINGPTLDATDSGNLSPQGVEGPGFSASPGCQTPSNIFANANGLDGLAKTGDDDFRLSSTSPALDKGMDSRTLGLSPSFNSILEADYYVDLTRPRIGKRGNQAQFDIGAHEYVIPNQAPVANAGQPTTVPSGTVINLNGTGSFDPDGDPLTYEWTRTAGPSVTISNPTSATPTLTAPQVQTPTGLTFQLTVNDGLESNAARVDVTVIKPNQLPVLAPIGHKTVAVGTILTFTVSAGDPDNDPLNYSVSPLPLPANASFDATTKVFTFTPTASQTGSFNLTVAVSDGRGGMASETITITITAGLSIKITTPLNGATIPAGQLLVRGTLTALGGGEVGVTVNGFPAGVQGTTFTALVFVTPETTSLTAIATSGSGTTASHSIAISVSASANISINLHASPTSGAAPLTVAFSLFSDVQVAQVGLDANGDGVIDYTGPQLDQHSYTFTQPGTYVATATAFDAQGNQFAANAVIQIYDATQLDGILGTKWAAMKDALRVGNIGAALNEIANHSRARYDEAFQIIAAQLPNIDQILTNITLVRIGNFSAVYNAVRIDDGLAMSFEVRFAVDRDGVWRMEAF